MKKCKAKSAPRRKALSQSEIVRTKGDLLVPPDASTLTGKIDKSARAKLEALPFIRSRKPGEKGRRFFWAVAASGKYMEDYNQGRAWARLFLPLLKYNSGAPTLSMIVEDMIAAGECNGIVLGFVREIADQLKSARMNLFFAAAAAATAPNVPAAHRKGYAEIRKIWRKCRSDIMADVKDAI
jgi:hypothetical protein